MDYVDFHIHSYYSDGTMSPKEILEEAARKKISRLAITDHNVLEGAKELGILCEQREIEYISGVELDVNEQGVNYHILGYDVDLENELFKMRVKENRAKLEEVNIKLIEKMAHDYKEVSLEEYNAFNYKRELGGWKTLHYLIHKGLAENVEDAFYYYQKYNHNYTCVDFPNVETVCQWIHEAGGKAVLAHPGRVIKTKDMEVFKKTILSMLPMGIEGIECYYPTHSKEIEKICLEICKEHNLIITSGSDCHGDFEETTIGQLKTKCSQVTL